MSAVRVVEVVGEQPADAARLAAMRQIEILVAGILEQWIGARPRGHAGGARGLMPGARVFVEGIHRRQVEAAAKPPDLAAARGEQAHVGMRRRRVGIHRVHDAARAHGAKRLAGQFRVALARRRRKSARR